MFKLFIFVFLKRQNPPPADKTQTNKHQAQTVLFIKLGVQHLGGYNQNMHYTVGYKGHNRWERHNSKLAAGVASFLGASLRHATRGVSRLPGRSALPVG
jgi:hypothetical protein